MDVFKLAAIALTGAVLSLTVKQYKQDIAVLTGLITGLVILFYVCSGVGDIFSQLSEIIEKSGVKMEYIAAIIKILGVCIISQFSAEVCRDAGQNAIASKLEMAGKILILTFTLPIISDFLDICIKTVNLLE